MRTQAGSSRTALPSGTITCLFADIEGSTRLLKELGDDYRTSLDAYQAIFRHAVGAAWGLSWVVIALLRATEPRERLPEIYPAYLRGDPAQTA